MSPGSQKTFRKSMLPGSQPRFRKRHPAVREPTLPGSQGCRLFAPRQSKEPTVRCTPVPGSQGIDVTRQPATLPGSQGCRLFAPRQSENRAIQDLTVGCQSTTRRSPSAARCPRPRIDVTRRSSLGRARGRGAAPAAPRPRAPEATPRSCAHAAPLRPSAWSGARRWGESCELSLSKI